MTKFTGLYQIRDSKPEDTNFILATFLRGLYYGDSIFSKMDKQSFMKNYDKVALALVNSPKVTIKVACLKEDPDVVLGYSMLSADYLTVHWVFVKRAWREGGIAASLLPAHPTTVSHLTAVGEKLLSKLNNPIFNPFSL